MSRALTAYEIAFREAQAGRLGHGLLVTRARMLGRVVAASLTKLRRDPATGATADAKALLVQALASRRRALELLAGGDLAGYAPRWNRSVVLARRGLTKLQDIRDEARLIPLPEDSVS